jgi:hypothetical protein
MTSQQDFAVRLNYVHNTYIQPEIDRRRHSGQLRDTIKVWECLVRLPANDVPIVQFNDEVGWEAESELVDGREVIKDRVYYAHEVLELKKIQPPKIKDEYVSYIYLFWEGYQYILLEDNTPSQEGFNPAVNSFACHDIVLRHINNKIMEKVVGNAKVVRERLHEIGLWVVTSLLYYPIAKIVERVGNRDSEGAKQVLVEYCNIDFLTEKTVNTWDSVAVFRERYNFFDDALFNHKHGRYHGSISILVGQIEGVITDWLYEIDHYSEDKKRSLPTKITDFRETLENVPNLLWMYREAKDSMLDFLDSEPWLQKFDKWMIYSNSSFPGRHVSQHGKYDHNVYTEENSIKLFLLLDTICQFMMFYEVRVLGRDLGQNNREISE